jgi:outer membrane protease
MINAIPFISGVLMLIIGIAASYRQERFAFETILPSIFMIVFFGLKLLGVG